MNKQISCAVSTAAMAVCSICHAWMLIQVLRVWASPDRTLASAEVSVALMVIYMLAVCLFNWHCLNSGSLVYRRVAVFSTALHLAGAVLQGAASEAVQSTGSNWLRLGVAIPSVLNLPMNSLETLYHLDSLLPWGTALFFAVNLAVLSLRMRKKPELEYA